MQRSRSWRTFTAPALALALTVGAAHADPKFDAEAQKVNGHFQQLDNLIKQGNWLHPRTEGTAQEHMKRLLQAIELAAKRFPEQKAITDRMQVGAQKMAQRVMAKMAEAKQAAATAAAQKPKSTGPAYVAGDLADDAAEALAAFYKPYYDSAKNFPAAWNASTVAASVDLLENFDTGALEAQVAVDRKSYPALFQYYGMEQAGKYADLPYGGSQRPNLKQKALQQLVQFYVPTIYEARAKFAGQGPALVAGIQQLIDGAKTLDDALLAQRLARICARLMPGDAGVAAMGPKAEAAVAAKTSAIQHLVTGPFHARHFKQIVGFSKATKPGQEDAGAVVTAFTPGKPLYLIGYLSQSVKSLGFRRRDSALGYEVTVYPDLAFQLPAMGRHLQLKLASPVTGDALDQVGVIEIPLLPDPDTVAFSSHLDYLPSLHFTKWLLRQPDGRHQLKLGLAGFPGVDPSKPGAFGSFAFELDGASRKALEDYYQRLWKKKLASVVFPDRFGIEDRKTDIPNASELAKYGTLLRLSAAQTNQVMKPWPNQTQVLNYVGQGYGAFEKDGRVSIIGLGFIRMPSEPKLRWTSLSGTPDHGTISDGKDSIGPELYNFGYEILKENVGKTGEW